MEWRLGDTNGVAKQSLNASRAAIQAYNQRLDDHIGSAAMQKCHALFHIPPLVSLIGAYALAMEKMFTPSLVSASQQNGHGE